MEQEEIYTSVEEVFEDLMWNNVPCEKWGHALRLYAEGLEPCLAHFIAKTGEPLTVDGA